jgi:hypothetical protein
VNDPAASDATMWIRFEFSRHVHAYLLDQIRFSDTKAGLAAAVAGVLFGAFRQVPLDPMTFPPRSASAGLQSALAALFVLFSLLTVANAYQVLRPRVPGRGRMGGIHHLAIEKLTQLFDHETGSTREGDLVNWSAIGAHAMRAAGADEYARAVSNQTPVELTAQLSAHSVTLAMIVDQKFQHVRFALNNLLLAAACLIVLMLEIGMTARP